MLSDNEILVRRIRYGCCALTFAEQAASARLYGDLKCAEEATRKWLYMLWAKGVMDSTPTGDEDRCGDVLYATAVAAKADCICTSCSGPGGSTTYDPSDPSGGGGGGGGGSSCEIPVYQTVVAAVDVSDRAAIEGAGPSVGDAFLIISGTTDGVWTPNTVQTWNGSGWDQSAVLDGNIFATEDIPSPSYWITVPGQPLPGNLFPMLDIVWEPGALTYTVVSQYPAVSLYMGRTILIYAIIGVNQLLVYSGPESTVATDLSLNIAGLGANGIAVEYALGSCEWGAGSTTIPPFECTFPRDHDCDDHNTLDHT